MTFFKCKLCCDEYLFYNNLCFECKVIGDIVKKYGSDIILDSLIRNKKKLEALHEKKIKEQNDIQEKEKIDNNTVLE